MDHPDLMGNYIGPKRDKQDRYCDLEANSNANSLNCMSGPEGGQGVQTPPLENHKAIGFLSNTGPGPLENHLTSCIKPAFNVGPLPLFSGIWILSPLISKRQKTKAS